MKSFLRHAVVFSLLAFAIGLVPHGAHAAGLVTCGQDSPILPNGKQACGFPEFMQLIANIIDFLIFVVAPLVFLCVVLMAGVTMLFSGGNTEARSKAIHMFTKALTGLVIAMVAWIAVKFILEKLEVVESVFPVFYK